MKAKAIDTETTWKNYRNVPFVSTITDEKLKTDLFDLREKSGVKSLKVVAYDKNLRKVFHNAPYDITCCKNLGIDILPPYEDTMTMANILNENFQSKALKPLAKLYLNEPCNEEKELSKIKSKLKRQAKKEGIIFQYDQIPSDILFPYAKMDTRYTMRLWKLFSKKIEKFRDVYNLELSIIPVIVEMQYLGMRIDRGFVKKQIDDYEDEQKKLYSLMVKEIKKVGVSFIIKKKYKRGPKKVEEWDKIKTVEDGVIAYKYEDFNPNSVDHISKVLSKLGIEIPVEIKVDKYGNEKEKRSTDMATLDRFKHIPFVERLLRNRFIEKQLSTYYRPLYFEYTGKDNDRAHFSFYQSGAKSGRFSAELVQTIPRREDDKGDRTRVIRNAFIPEKGYTWVSIDYDQVEMRLFAHFSNNKLFIKYLIEGGDPHLQTAIEIWGEKEVLKNDDTKKSYRKKAKGINFGIIYGMGQNLLAESLKIPVMEARDVLSKYDKRYQVREYINQVISSLYHNGFVSVCFDSPQMKMYREYRVPQELAYKAVNIMVQGTAAYVMKFGMRRCWDYIKEHKLDVRMLGTIHDELIFEVSNKYDVKSVTKKLVECMEDRVTFKVPVLATPKISKKSWGEAKDVKL